MVAGVAGIARTAARFVVAIALVGAVVNALLLTHLAVLPGLRVIGGMLVVAGCVTIATGWSAAISRVRGFWGGSFFDKVAFVVAACSVGGLGFAAVGPVTDPDSLDYHLGVPLDWLRHGGVTVEPHWLHARLTGLGEALNTLGLAAGTDCLGAVLQVSGLVVVMAVLAGAGKTVRDRMFGLLLALPPVILPLSTSQKPQLLPVAGLVVAMMLARTAQSGADFALVFGCAAFAVACKYSFAVSGGVVVVAALVWAWRRGRLRVASGWAVVAFAVLVLPGLGRNFVLYGDPVSPFLEGLRAHPDREVTQFATYLGNVGDTHTAEGIARFVGHTIWPDGAGDVQTVLGIGLAGLFLAAGTQGSFAALAGFAAVFGFTLWRGQMAPRYLLEGYLWCAAVAVAVPWSRFKSLLFYGLTVQTAGVAAMALFAAGMLFPGALTPGLREWVMQRMTYGYAEARWADRVVPKNATLMSEGRAYALMPRPFRIPRCAACGSAPLLELLKPGDLGAGVLIMEYPVEGTFPEGCAATVLAGPVGLRYAARNPFNRRAYQVVAIRAVC